VSLRTRILACPPERPVPRHVVDWLVQNQDKARILVPRALIDHPKGLARLGHAPFEPPPPALADLARSIAGALGAPRPEPLPGPDAPMPAVGIAGASGSPAWAVEAAAMALLERAAVLLPHPELFADVIPLSSWSMNVPAAPLDAVLAPHAQIAAGLTDAFREDARAALEALIAGDPARLERVRRERCRHARTDGPQRFAAIAPRSEGRRPAVVYLDLLRGPAAADSPFRDLLTTLDRPAATRLCAMAGGLFLF
jgi:hypothetical protein